MSDDLLFQDMVLYVFKKRKTAFLMTETILKEIRFQKEIDPKVDKERLDVLLEKMREQDLVVLNQPKFAALSPGGKAVVDQMTEQRIAEIVGEIEKRSK